MRLTRLRAGEWLAGAASVALLVALFAGAWYHDPVRDGFSAMPVLRWFCLVAAALGLALWLSQATSRGPALPVTLDLLGMLFAGLVTLLLVVRLLSTSASLGWGAYLGVLAVAALAVGAFRALRVEHGWTPGPQSPVELVGPTSVDH